MSSKGGKRPVKVVIINTEYVETDAGSFKSIVQKLTGKDAIVLGSPSWEEARTGEGPVLRPQRSLKVLDRNWSIREFDRLIKDMPTVDELCQLWN